MKTYDIALFKGHGYYNGTYDPGAVSGQYKEQEIVSEIVDKAVKLLRAEGISVLTGENNYNNNLLENCTIKTKYACEVHCNAGKGTRTELIVPKGEKYFDTEISLGKYMVSLGIPEYRIVSRDYVSEKFISRETGKALSGDDWYKVIRNAWKKGISLTIFELGFIDSSDVKILVANKDKIALKIASELASLCGKTITLTTPSKPVTSDSDIKYRVVTGSFSNKENANKRIEELKKAGFDSFLVVE